MGDVPLGFVLIQGTPVLASCVGMACSEIREGFSIKDLTKNHCKQIICASFKS